MRSAIKKDKIMKKLTMAELQSYKNFYHDLVNLKDSENPYDLRIKWGLSKDDCDIFADSFSPLHASDEKWLEVANEFLESHEIYEDNLAFDYDF